MSFPAEWLFLFFGIGFLDSARFALRLLTFVSVRSSTQTGRWAFRHRFNQNGLGLA